MSPWRSVEVPWRFSLINTPTHTYTHPHTEAKERTSDGTEDGCGDGNEGSSGDGNRNWDRGRERERHWRREVGRGGALVSVTSGKKQSRRLNTTIAYSASSL